MLLLSAGVGVEVRFAGSDTPENRKTCDIVKVSAPVQGYVFVLKCDGSKYM